LVGVFRGYNIGIRLIDEFLAKSNVSRCVDFRETADVIAKVLFFGFYICWEKCEKVYLDCGEGHLEMALLLVHLIFGNLQLYRVPLICSTSK
jgi:hypothetical protein